MAYKTGSDKSDRGPGWDVLPQMDNITTPFENIKPESISPAFWGKKRTYPNVMLISLL